MVTRTAGKIARSFVASIVLIALGASQSFASPYLWWKMELRDAQNGPNGMTFNVYGTQRKLDFVVTFVNEDSDEGLAIPSSYVEKLRLSASDGNGRNVSIETRWSAAVLVASGVEYMVSAEDGATLWPGDRLEVQGSLVQGNEREFAPGVYDVTLDVGPAAKDIRTASGGVWNGRYEPQGTVKVHLIEPQTPEERRAQRIIEAQRALEKDESLGALQHYRALIQNDPRDIEARTIAGRAYLQLGRFREAADEFEAVLPFVVGQRSMLYFWLAHAYVGIGDTQKAESLLRQQVPAEAVSRQIQAMRDDVNRPGRRR